MNSKIILVLLASFLLFGCVENDQSNNELTNEETNNLVSFYTLEEVAMHSTPDDCWFVIEGDVYDATPYIARGIHPGGEAILDGCGKDVTEMFSSTRGGSGHSTSARNFSKQFIIGELAQ